MRWLRLILLIALAWVVMTTTHELGHIVAGCACGGTLASYSLSPISLPFSIFEPDPHPLVTLWSGPILGASVPVLIAWLFKHSYAMFIGYFCLLANGVYIGCAWFSGDQYLDTPKLLEHGASHASILIYCLITIGFGYLGFRHQCMTILKPESAKGGGNHP
ncbi:MAG: hypothetical protein AAF483_18905 [Planctomycetota bacterium]